MTARKILIVDDEPYVLNALSRSLRKEGHDILCRPDAAQGLVAIKEHQIDMVVSDHLMPNMTGLEFLRLVRDRSPDTVRLLLTGHADMQTAVDAINHGQIYRFLTKPWDDVELKVTVYLAFEMLDLERRNRALLATLRNQKELIKTLEVSLPVSKTIVRDESGAILIEDEPSLRF